MSSNDTASAMDPLTLMKSHRSIRRFETTPIPSAHIKEAVRCGQMASTSSAVQAYSVIHVTDDRKLDTLAQLAGPQEKVKRCGAFFVLCADTRRHRLMCERAKEPYYNSFEALLVAIADVSFFAQNMSLAFESMGYGICYIGGMRNDLLLVIETLGLPEGVFPVYGLCAGIPLENPTIRPRLAYDAFLFENEYSGDDTLMDGIARYDEGYKDYLAARGTEPKGWSDAMVARNSRAIREEVGEVFKSQGGKLG